MKWKAAGCGDAARASYHTDMRFLFLHMAERKMLNIIENHL